MTQEFREETENGIWLIDGCGFYIQRWEVVFDPLHHNMYRIQDWFKLPNLPFEFW